MREVMGYKMKQSQRKHRSIHLSRRLLCGASFLAGVVALGVGSAAQAGDRHWDANRTGVGTGGAGTWDLSGANWSPSADGVSGPYTAWDNSALDDAIFGGTAGTVTVAAPIVVHNLTFDVASYILSGSSLTLDGLVPTITTKADARIDSILAGTKGLTKNGTGMLQLYGANVFSGNILLNAGGIHAVNDAALGALSNNIATAVGANVTLRIDGASTARTVTIGDGGTLNVSGAGVGAARITGNGNVYVMPSNSAATIVRLTNDSSDYTGTTTFRGCSGICNAYFSSIGNLGEASSLGAPTTVENGTINFTQINNYTDNVIYIGDGDSSDRNWKISGTGALVRNEGSGALTITGDIVGGTSTQFIATSADINLLGTISGGAFAFSAGTGQVITLGDANTFTGVASIGGTARAGMLANSGVASSLGAGSTIAINAGELVYTGAGANSDRAWTINGASGLVNDGTGALALSGTLGFLPAAPNPDSLTLGGSFAGTNIFAGVISGTGNLISNGSGTWVLNGANSFAGTVTVNNGTLRAGTASGFGAATDFTVNAGTLDLGGFDRSILKLAGTGGSIALGAATLTIDGAASSSFAGSIAGSGSLLKRGTSTLTLSGANSYTGATTINGGALTLDFTPAGAPTSNIISDASTLILAGGALAVTGAAGVTNSQTFNGLDITAGSNRILGTAGAGGSLTLDLGVINRTGGLIDFTLNGAGEIRTSSATLGGWATVNGTDYAKVVGGVITAFTDADYMTKDDAATWLNGEYITDADGNADSFYGTVSGTIQLGGLRYTVADPTPNPNVVTVGAGQTLGVDGAIIVASSVGANNQMITGGSLTGAVGDSVLGFQHNGAGELTIASTIVDNGGNTAVTKGGVGTLVLTGANSYTGATILTGGMLRVNSFANGGVASAIGASSADASNLVLENGILKYSGATTSTDRGFTLVNGGTSRTIDVVGGTNLTFTGVVTSPDDAGFTKLNAGTLTLANAANTYSGVTTVGGGTLAVTTLTNGGLASSIGMASSDPANIVLAGGTLAYLGGTASSDRGITIGAGNGSVGVTDANAVLTLTGTLTSSGSGGLRKEGAGTLILSGTNSYTGGTIVNAGTLRAGSANAFGPGTGVITINGGSTLELGGFNITAGAVTGGGTINLGTQTLTTTGVSGVFTGKITGSGGFTRGPVAGGGGPTQSLNGCANDYTGITTIHGSLSTDCLAKGGVASGIGASGAGSGNLVFNNGFLNYTGASVVTDRGFTTIGTAYLGVSNAATTLEYQGQAIGTGGVRKDGAGTLILSGNNSYAGGTSITGGVLRAGSATAFGGAAGLTLSSSAAVTVELAGYDAAFTLLTGGVAGGVIDLGGADITITTGGSVTGAAFAGQITGTGSLIKNGVNTGNNNIQRLSGCANDYSGSTTINGGVIEAMCLTDGGLASSIGMSGDAAANLVLNGGTLRYIGAADSTNRRFTLGAGTSTLDASGTGVIDFTSSAPVTFGTANTAQTLTLGGTNTGNNILAAQLTNNGSGVTSLTKNGAGTWVLTNQASSYTGITRIDGGVLAVDKLANGGLVSSIGMSSAAAANLVIGNGSTLRYTGTGDTTNRLFTLALGTTFIESSGTGALVFTDTGLVTLANPNQTRTIALGGTNTGNNTLAGSIGNAGTGITTLAKNDSGTWVLTGNHNYTGNTIINGGTLILGNGGTTGAIISQNTINQGKLVFNRSDSYTYAGVIANVGAVEQRGSGTTILTGANSYTGGTTISAGALQLGAGGTSGSIVGDVLNDGLLIFNRSDVATFNGVISGSGAVTQQGSGTTVLSGTNSYAGGTSLLGGTLQVGLDANLGAAAGDLTFNGGTLQTTSDFISARTVTLAGAGTILTNALTTLTLSGTISGSGSFTKSGAGALVLTGNGNAPAGGTTIAAGTLQLGNGGTSGALTGNVANNGSLIFNRSDDIVFNGLISGTGTVTQNGSGIVNLTANNSYKGATTLNVGTLLINGDQSAATGVMTVNNGATLGGSGTIGGNVSIANGGILKPGNSPGTLTIAGDLTLSSGSVLNYEFGQADVAGGPLNDLVNVGGNLVLDGTINVSVPTGGTFGGGIYRVFNYGGTLTNNDLTLGTMPAGSDVTVQTSVAGQVNLVNSAGLSLSFWDGDAGPKFNSQVDGGNGLWHLGGADNNWTDAMGGINASYADATYAIFSGTAGNVVVDNGSGLVRATGMQFASTGYTIRGNPLTLVGPQSVIRVGDGTALGAGFLATIESALTGTSQLVKTDLGTLVLAGANSYTGGTLIDDGTLRIASDASLGDAAGAITIRNGTLQTTANVTTSRAITLTGAATFLTNPGTSYSVSSVIDGTGSLTKAGTGTLVLTGDASHSGGTTIAAGTLQVGNGGITGSLAGNVTNNGALIFNRANALTYAGQVSGTGSLSKTGAGTLTMTGVSSYTGATAVSGGTLVLQAGGRIEGTASLTVNTGGEMVIDGTGSHLAAGPATSYVGNASQGALSVTNGATAAFGGLIVANQSTSIGRVDIVGAGSQIVSSTLEAGMAGMATINILGGGQLLTDGLARIGRLGIGQANSVTVSGTGSQWNIASTLYGHNGSLIISDGGRVTADLANLATPNLLGSAATASLLVTGADSRFETTKGFNLTNDAKGTGRITIADGGVVAVGGGTLAMGLGDAALNIGGAEGAAAAHAGMLDAAAVTFAAAGNRINFNHDAADYTFSAAISGAGFVNHAGSGNTVLTGTNSYGGDTVVNAGGLYINGDQSGATGQTLVGPAGTLGGTGTIGGGVLVFDGVLDPGALGTAPGTLTINGNLGLSTGATLNVDFGQAGIVGGAFNDLINVQGDLVLDGTLNVRTTAGGSFDPGIYRVINYGGTLTNNGVTIGTIPSPDFYVQTSVAGQVNLVNTAGLTFRYWDGPSSKNDGVIDGGNGLWQRSIGNENWVDDGQIPNAPFTDDAFAVFMGAAGTVTVDGSLGNVTAGGMQFLTDGYVIDGAAITLVGTQAVIRTGDGTAVGADINATIDSQLTGTAQLVKADLGTLILTGSNGYTGGTAINGGTLRVSADGNLGAAAGNLSFVGGTLNTTADIASNRAVDLVGTGTFLTDAGTTFALSGAVSGAGSLTKSGAGTLILRGASAFDGTMAADDGMLSIADGGSVSSYNGFIGSESGQTGEVVVSGPGSSWINTSHLTVGSDGTGILRVEAGAEVSNAHGSIGANVGSTGVMTVSGPGSSWTSSQSMYVGNRGDGFLTVEAGGVASAVGSIGLATFLGSNSAVVVSGAGSRLTTPSALFVGNEGEAVLTIADSAEASSQASYIGYFAGSSGTINIGAAAGAGPTTAGMLNTSSLEFRDGDGTLVFNHTDTDYVFSAGLQAAGTGTHIVDHLAGRTLLTGDGSGFDGTTNVLGGTLLVGDRAGNGSLGGIVNVELGGTLGGSGTLGSNVTIADGGILKPGNSPGTLTIAGNLSLSAGSILDFEFGEANVVGGALNDLINVGGDLVLDGTLNVSVPAGGEFGAGIYRVFNYGGTLTDNGLALGIMPAGNMTTVQTSIAGQVNLVNTAGLMLNFWDGAGPKFDNIVAGGDGVWQSGAGNDNWTDVAGGVNAGYADGAIAIFAGTGGQVTIDNSLGAVEAAGLQFAVDGYEIGGGTLTLTGPQASIRVGDGSVAGADFTAIIASELAGATQLVKTDAGTLILSGANSYTGGTAIEGGTLAIAADGNLGIATGEVALSGGTLQTLASLTSDRAVALTGSGTILTDSGTTFTLNGLLSGTGALTKDGEGTLLLTGDSDGYRTATQIAGGTLAVDGKLGSIVTVAQAGRLEGAGQVGGIVNAGVVAPGRDGIGTLTVVGDYVGNGGTLAIETVLGDDSSQTSRLVINGATSGITQVNVTNRGGLGAVTAEGIKVIDVAGASDGRFTLDGDYLFGGEQAVIAGAYGYRLYQGGVANPADGDWYLRSSLLDPGEPEQPGEPALPIYQPGVPIYEVYGANLLALNTLPTLQQRVGNRSWAAGANPEGTGIWGRMEGTRNRANALISTSGTDQTINSWKLQLGADRALKTTDKGERLVAGVTAHYGQANSHVRSLFGNGALETDGYGLGATLTWYGLQGFYLDGQAQLSWYDSDLDSNVLGRLVRGNDGRGEAFSVEAGKRTSISGKLSLTPQIQMAYSNVRFDRFADPADAIVASGKGDSLTTRGGIALDHQSVWEGGQSHVYGIVNLNYEWLDGTRTTVSGTPLEHANERLWGEIGLGASISWTKGVTLYGEVSGNSPFRDFGDSYMLKANAGVRIAF